MQIKDISKSESLKENLETWCYEVGSRFEQYSVDAANEFHNFLIKNNNKINKILDLGAGDGAASREFIRLGYEVTSVDINEEKLAEIVGAKTVVQDMYSYVNENTLYNVFTHHSLEHVVDAADIIEMIGYQMLSECFYYATVPAEDYLHSVHHVVFEDWRELLPPSCLLLEGMQRERLEEKEFMCLAKRI